MSATASQRISFTQLVLDMGLADRKALLRAKKLIKERQAEGKKMTLARACVELEVLTERQAKKVQLELKRLKAGLTASDAFEEDANPKPEPQARTKKKAKPAKDDEDVADAKPKKKAKPAKDDEAVADAKPKKKAKPTKDDEAVADAEPKKKAKPTKDDEAVA
ncbi:MAG: hypothetical protein KDD82_04570, partial [Planctomycetes bacterium]|nr:hypothetical protein [Planctomycetota bacterium]